MQTEREDGLNRTICRTAVLTKTRPLNLPVSELEMTANITRGRKSMLFMALPLAAFVLWAVAAAAPSPQDVIKVHTEPYMRSQPTFPAIGIVRSVAVREGQVVKKGDVLMAQDDDIEQDELKRLRLEAESTARMEYAVSDRDYKKVKHERESKEPGAFSPSEIEEAQLDVERADAQIKVTDLDTQDSKFKANQQKTKVGKMVLRSAIDGVVKEIRFHEGDLTSMEPEKPAIIIVQNNPCYVVISELKTWQVSRLKEGETLEVKYEDDAQWQQAKIVYISPEASASSDLQMVKLELPNPENRATGLPIDVKLPPKLLERGPAQGITSR